VSKKIHKKPKGTFVFIDDDKDEHFLLKMAMKSLGLTNPVLCFSHGQEALSFLKESQEEIFVVLCDITMPKMDGLELKRIIDLTPELKVKCIPFFFHSSNDKPTEIRTAYSMNIQGYLMKAPDLEGTIESLHRVIELWTDCVHPKDLNSI
jgi:CheY-like chemotaxis protein